MRIIIFKFILAYSLLINSSFAGIDEVYLKYKENIRPYLSNILGKDVVDKILGPAPEKIILPKIPQILNDATKLTEVKNQDSDSKIKNVPAEKLNDFNIIFLNELYEVTLGSKISDEDLNSWMNALNQGSAREGIYRAVVFGDKYAAFEANKDPKGITTEEAQKFALYFLEKYINEKHAEESFKSLNIYSTKRLCVEKALEVVDILQLGKASDLEDWYSVLSSDLATRFPLIWGKSKLRADPSLEVHKNWASKAPLQFLKSELIIKLHKTFNSFI